MKFVLKYPNIIGKFNNDIKGWNEIYVEMGESKIPFTIVDIVLFLQTVRRGGTNLLFLKSVIFSEMASCKVLSQMRLFIGPNQIFKRMKENEGKEGGTERGL